MEKLNHALSSLKAVKDGHVSRSRVDKVGETALKALKLTSSGEVAQVLFLHCQSSSPDQRLAAVYALHAVVWGEKKRLEEKNGKQPTEKRGELSIALESKMEGIFALLRDLAPKEREQVGKILAKWLDRGVFPADLCRRLASSANCVLPHTSAPPAIAASAATVRSAPAYAPPVLPPISVNLSTSAPAPSLPGLGPVLTTAAPKSSSSGGWGSISRGTSSAAAAAAPAPIASRGGGSMRSPDRHSSYRRQPSPPSSHSSYARDKRSRWGD